MGEINLHKKVKVYQNVLEEVLPRIFSRKLRGNVLTLEQVLGRSIHIAYFETESNPLFIEEKIRKIKCLTENGELKKALFYFQGENNPRILLWEAKTRECFILLMGADIQYPCIIID